MALASSTSLPALKKEPRVNHLGLRSRPLQSRHKYLPGQTLLAYDQNNKTKDQEMKELHWALVCDVRAFADFSLPKLRNLLELCQLGTEPGAFLMGPQSFRLVFQQMGVTDNGPPHKARRACAQEQQHHHQYSTTVHLHRTAFHTAPTHTLRTLKRLSTCEPIFDSGAGVSEIAVLARRIFKVYSDRFGGEKVDYREIVRAFITATDASIEAKLALLLEV